MPQPSCDTFAFGGPNGYLDLFTGDSSFAKQWKYTDAPDADARVVQVVYQAEKWAEAQGKSAEIADIVQKASKLGDYLRYAMFDKYFKKIGDCVGATSCPAGTGKDSEHYLLAWYYAWGGSLDTANGWAWWIGDGAAHQGYQNPLAAYALANVIPPSVDSTAFQPSDEVSDDFESQTGTVPWTVSAPNCSGTGKATVDTAWRIAARSPSGSTVAGTTATTNS